MSLFDQFQLGRCSLLGLVLLTHSCDRKTVDDDVSASSNNTRFRESSDVGRQRSGGRSEDIVEASKLLKSLKGLSNDQIDKRLKGNVQWAALVKNLSGAEVEELLAQIGYVRDGKGSGGNALATLYGLYCIDKSKVDPKGFAEWVIASKQNELLSHIYYLGANDPELAAEVIIASDVSSRVKADSFGAVFEQASATDPHRAVRLFQVTKFANPDEIESAMIGVISGIDRESATPKKVREIVSGFSKASLNSVPTGVRCVGGLLAHSPVVEVLESFPLDGEPWERAVAVQYLENKAHHGVDGDREIKDFLESNQAKFLSGQEIDRLNATLGR